MNIFEYQEARQTLPLRRKFLKELKPGNKAFRKISEEFFEALIAVHGHAWCMDVQEERKKISKLLSRAVCDIF